MQLDECSPESLFEKDQQGHPDASAHLPSEHQNIVHDINGFLEQRAELTQQIHAMAAERQDLFLKVVSVTSRVE